MQKTADLNKLTELLKCEISFLNHNQTANSFDCMSKQASSFVEIEIVDDDDDDGQDGVWYDEEPSESKENDDLNVKSSGNDKPERKFDNSSPVNVKTPVKLFDGEDQDESVINENTRSNTNRDPTLTKNDN